MAPRANKTGGRPQQRSAKDTPEMPNVTNRFRSREAGTGKPSSRKADARKSLAPGPPVSDNLMVPLLPAEDDATSSWILRNVQQSRSSAISLPAASNAVRDALNVSSKPFGRDSIRVRTSFS